MYPVPPGRGFGVLAIPGNQLIAREVQVVLRGRIGALRLVQRAVESHSVKAQPAQIVIALLTEIAERLIRDHTLGFELEILVHLLGSVLITGLPLYLGATTIVDAATNGRGAAAFEAINRENIGTRGSSLERRTGTGAPETYDHHIGAIQPVRLLHTVQCQSRFNIGMPVGLAWLRCGLYPHAARSDHPPYR
jgi:hypothetical protein